MVNLVDRVFPGFAGRLSRWMYEKNGFPWSPVDTELIAFGTGAAVFKLDWKSGCKVLRIYRRSLGKPVHGLVEIAGYYKKNYERVLSWYGDAGDLVLPMDFLVLPGLPFIGPVAASLQPYIQGQKQDFFEDFSDDELLGLFRENGHIRKQFLTFAEQTIRQWDGGKMCYDFLGRENIMLVKQGQEYRMHIVDVGIFKFDAPAATYSVEKLGQIDRRIQRLANLYDRAGVI